MSEAGYDLFFVFLRLKSYLISLIDDPEDCENNFSYTEEYLERVYPEYKEDIIELLRDFDINTDCDIAFDQDIHLKFKDIVQHTLGVKELPEILDQYQINISKDTNIDEEFSKVKKLRDFKLNHIINVLLQLIKTWTVHNELERNVDNYTELDEEELLRPEENSQLDKLGKNTELSQRNIAILTEKYIELMADYYFNYGGNVTLKTFINNLSTLESKVNDKYKKLILQHGFNPDDFKD